MKRQGTLLLIATILAMLVNLAPTQQMTLAAVPSDLFFSEYIEGTSFSKALEIYNGTGVDVDLAAGGYAVQFYFNGANVPSVSIDLTGTVVSGDVFVLASSSSAAGILAQADLFSDESFFNGDDAVALAKGGALVDVIGQIGYRPIPEWGTDPTATLNNTLIRKNTVCAGDPIGSDVFDPALEWDGYAVDTFTGLGAHSTVCAPDASAPSVSSTTPADQDTEVVLDASIAITFSEPVTVTGDWFQISCTISGLHSAVVTDADPLFTLAPDAPFQMGDVCTVTVYAEQVNDDDSDDPPDNMLSDYLFSFSTLKMPKINEYSANTADTDVEYVELFGSPNTDYSAYTVLEIEGDYSDGAAEGYIDHVIPMGTTDANGLFLMNLLANDLENGTISLLLVEGFTGALGNDIDTNDDGVIDMPYWTALVDSIAVNDGGSGDRSYGSTVLTAYYDGLAYTPGGASRIPDGYDTESVTDWVRNDFDLAGIPGYTGSLVVGEAYNTPGAFNMVYVPVETAPSVKTTFPANGATDVETNAAIEITFTEPVTLVDPWFDVTCTSSGIHTATVTDADPKFTLTMDEPFVTLETCTVTVYAAQVTDDDTDDPPDLMEADYVFSFSVPVPPEVCGDPFTPIYDIQGAGAVTPLLGQEVATEGIVVGDFQTGRSGFYIQTAAGDGDLNTSDGIFIYSTLVDVQPGDHVRVRGLAAEYPTTPPSLTQISTVSKIWVCSTGNTIEPTVLSLPVAQDFEYEDYESMLVTYPQQLVISEYYNFDRYGEIVITSERHTTPTAEFEPGSPEVVQAVQDYLLDKIVLDDGRSWQNPDPAIHPNGLVFDLTNLFRGGDLVQNVTGILDYYASAYRIQPIQGADYIPANPRTLAPDLEAGDLTVASFNVLNYFLTIDDGVNDICGPSGDMECRGADSLEELARQRAKILAALSGINADVFGLMEIQNDEDQSTADLVAGLNDIFGADTFAYISTGYIGTDAIKQALIYKTAAVTPVGEYKILDSTVDPRFLDDYNRPVLAQTFADNLTGSIITVAVNHLKSKGSDCNDVGDPDLGDGAGNCNLTRKTAAEAEVDWLASDPTETGATEYLIIGDLNSYDKEDPIDAIKLGPDGTAGTADDYLDMMFEFNGEYAYGYVYDGQIGYLDYAMANLSLADNIIDVDFWHINADEPDLINYDMDYKAPAQDAIYAPDAYRSSDHDPVIVTLSLDHVYAAVDDSYATDQATPLDVAAPGVMANDTTANPGDTLTVELLTDVQFGTLVLASDGSFTYTPLAAFIGQDSFVYNLVSQLTGEVVATGTVTITVNEYGVLYFMPWVPTIVATP